MEKTSKMVFRNQYEKLSDVQKDLLRKRVIEESGMAYATFYYKFRTTSFAESRMVVFLSIFLLFTH